MDSLDQSFRASLLSFHRLDSAEVVEMAGARLHVAAAEPGETSQTFASRMSVSTKPLEEFLALNGLDRGGPLVAGQLYKFAAP